MAGSGRKTFTAGEVLTASDVNGYLQDQAVMNFAGTAARASAIPSPSEGMVTHVGGGTVEVYDGSAWVALGGVPAAQISDTPTGSYTGYQYWTFTASGTLNVTTAGFAEIMVVGGGAGGANGGGGYTAGGGGGGVRWGGFTLPSGSITITIGAGGGVGTNGSPSSCVGVLLCGGGGQPLADANAASNVGLNANGGGGSGGGIAIKDAGSGYTGGGAGGTLYGANSYSGISLAYNNTSTEYGKGGYSGGGSGAANTGNGGWGTTATGGSGIVIVRVAV
jgi:hypothetical protein